MIAKVIVDVKSKNVDKTYDYLIPLEYQHILQIGARVIVPFGSRKVMGFVLDISSESTSKYQLKEIELVLDLQSFLSKELIDLAYQLKDESSALLINVLQMMLPSALKVAYRPILEVVDKERMPNELFPTFEYTDKVLLSLIDKALYPHIKSGIKNKSLRQLYDIKPKNKNLSFKYAKLTTKKPEKLSIKQMNVYHYLNDLKDKTDSVVNIKNKFNISQSIINTLEKHGYLNVFYKEQYRYVKSNYVTKQKDIILNEEQSVAYHRILECLDEEKVFLLHGVTGSGKTEIYLDSIEAVIKQNKTVIFLVPEISLTPMMLSRFRNRFGDLVAVLHSGLSVMEKYDEWRRIVSKEAKIVIGARSACFAPLDHLGLVVVDECHESTYKQINMPNYYAIDVLKKRIKFHQCPMILGSATPNIESYARHIKGYYELLHLPNRAINSSLPTIEVVDMKEEVMKGNSNSLSEKLQKEISSRLDKSEQVILLMNRRGHSNFVICRNCGSVIKCPNCDISLTYHEQSHSLKCHYCNHDEAIPKKCPKCESTDLRYMGSGTQKVENELNSLFPEAKVVRMDNDTTRRKNAHEKLLKEFETKGDILLGTQMIAKGLDFPRVTLVGIIQADNNLHVPDFRAPEKTFQLLMQVSGRAGRRDILGKVIVQAYNPEHYAIKYATNNDYDGFYHHEMRIRRLARYSPFYYMIELKIFAPSMRDSFYNGIEIVKHLRRHLDNSPIVLGPAIPEINRINNRYITEVMIKYKSLGNLNKILNDIIDKYQINDNSVRIDRFPDVG